MAQEEWNRLEAGELVFDPVIFRRRPYLAGNTVKPDVVYAEPRSGKELRAAADPVELNAAGLATCISIVSTGTAQRHPAGEPE